MSCVSDGLVDVGVDLIISLHGDEYVLRVSVTLTSHSEITLDAKVVE